MKKIFKVFFVFNSIFVVSCGNLGVNLGEFINQVQSDSLLMHNATIRAKYDSWAKFTYNQYEEILHLLLNRKDVIILPMCEFNEFRDSTKLVVGLRHDVDYHPFKALEIAQMENKMGIRSTYYILPTAFYYGFMDSIRGFIRYKFMLEVYKRIYALGHEIGIHNDLLTVMVVYREDPIEFNRQDFEFLSEGGIRIRGTSSHGAPLCRETEVFNYEIFKDFTKRQFFTYKGKSYPLGIDSLKRFGFEYEANFTTFGYDYFFTDNGGQLFVKHRRDTHFTKVTYEKFIEKLQNLKSGQRIVLLIHPVWWGKK
ncbi:MAG: hypothetical protein ABIM32_03190 [candidate division WOR-3 bacterium]